MVNANEICQKIRSVFPDIGECGIDLHVNFEKEKNAWAVHLSKESHKLTTYLEIDDADNCLEKERCVGLGFQIAQLRNNISRS